MAERIHVSGVKFWNQRWLGCLLQQRFGARPQFHERVEQALAASVGASEPVVAWAAALSETQADAVRDSGGWLVEDGFLRSVGLGAGLNAGLSYVLDRRGIYYDARRPSDLEHLLQQARPDAAQRDRGARLIRLLIEAAVSKYNLPAAREVLLPRDGRRRLLVVGQVENDASILSSETPALAELRDQGINQALLRRTREDNPGACIVYKPHPDVAAGLRPGQVAAEVLAQCADRVVEEGDVLPLLDWCDELHTVSSLAGFEALIRGKIVVTHGSPFYAGWGLSRDHCPFPRRGRQLLLEELVYLTLVEYCHYVDPASGNRCQPEYLIGWLSAQRNRRLPQAKARLLTGVSWAARKLGI